MDIRMTDDEIKNLQTGVLLLAARAARRCSPKHLQHLSYLIQEGAGVPTRHEFTYRYGPHSRTVEDRTDSLHYTGYLKRQEQKGMLGWVIIPYLIYDHRMRERELRFTQPAEEFRDMVQSAARQYPGKNSLETNIAATILYMSRSAPARPRADTIRAAQRAMPKLSTEALEREYQRLAELGWLAAS